MSSDYFKRLTEETSTRFWINNPSGVELDLAIETGAINCTTNPAYCSKLLVSEPEYIRGVIDEVIREVDDIDAAAVRIYQEVSARVMAKFLPLFEQSSGGYGYVTMQDDPRLDEDTDAIVNSALSNRQLGPNFMTKIPVIEGGLQAIEACVAENMAICATEVFSIAQAIHICDLYEQAVEKTGNTPPFYVTHITGIYDEYLEKVARREGIDVSASALSQAGNAIARREYRLLKERGYHTTMLGGGARGTHHFTEMVGGDVHITINWSTAQDIIDANTPLISRLDAETPQSVIDELMEKFADFRKAYDEDGLSVEEYADFGPVQLFRHAFLKGYYLLLAEIASRHNLHAL
jgi:transaldolase